MEAIVVVAGLIIWIVNLVRKEAERRKEKEARQERARQMPQAQEEPAIAPEPAQPTVRMPALPARYEDAQDYVTAWTNEPKEPKREPEAAAVGIPGLGLRFTGDEMVKGVIFSEILQRKEARRTR